MSSRWFYSCYLNWIEFLPITYRQRHFVSKKNAAGVLFVSPATHECSDTACMCELCQLVDLSAPQSHHSGPPPLFFSLSTSFQHRRFICSSSRAVTMASGVTTAFPTLRRVPEQAQLISKYMLGLICSAAVEANFNSTWETQSICWF